MKNVTPSQRAALKDRAARIARLLPPLPREPSGALTPASREAFRQTCGPSAPVIPGGRTEDRRDHGSSHPVVHAKAGAHGTRRSCR